MPNRKRSERELEQRRISNRSFKIWNPDGSLYAEMFEGKWIKKPKIKKTIEEEKMPLIKYGTFLYPAILEEFAFTQFAVLLGIFEIYFDLGIFPVFMNFRESFLFSMIEVV